MVILTVEDDVLVSDVLGDMLTDAGHEAVAAYRADHAITVLEERSDIRVVITDIDMPGSMDGLRLAATIRDRWPPMHNIVTTGKTRPRIADMPPGITFVPKPYDSAAIEGAVRTFS